MRSGLMAILAVLRNGNSISWDSCRGCPLSNQVYISRKLGCSMILIPQ